MSQWNEFYLILRNNLKKKEMLCWIISNWLFNLVELPLIFDITKLVKFRDVKNSWKSIVSIEHRDSCYIKDVSKRLHNIALFTYEYVSTILRIIWIQFLSFFRI